MLTFVIMVSLSPSLQPRSRYFVGHVLRDVASLEPCWVNGSHDFNGAGIRRGRFGTPCPAAGASSLKAGYVYCTIPLFLALTYV